MEYNDIEAQIDTYIAERDKPTDMKWKERKSLCAILFGLLDHLPKAKKAYNAAKYEVFTIANSGEAYMFNPGNIEFAKRTFYREQESLTRLLILIQDIRKEIAEL